MYLSVSIVCICVYFTCHNHYSSGRLAGRTQWAVGLLLPGSRLHCLAVCPPTAGPAVGGCTDGPAVLCWALARRAAALGRWAMGTGTLNMMHSVPGPPAADSSSLESSLSAAVRPGFKLDRSCHPVSQSLFTLATGPWGRAAGYYHVALSARHSDSDSHDWHCGTQTARCHCRLQVTGGQSTRAGPRR
jgi:hypothetical protein